jgi:hypothetical protein
MEGWGHEILARKELEIVTGGKSKGDIKRMCRLKTF